MASLSISQAWEETKARIAADGKLMMVVAAALIALPALVSGVVSPKSPTGEASLLTATVVLISSLLTIIGQLAIIRLAIRPGVSVGEAIGHGARRMPVYLVAGITLAIILFVAAIPLGLLLIALGVPLDRDAMADSGIALLVICLFIAFALFVGTRMLMTSPVASEESVGPIAILRRSWELTAGHFWRLFGFLVIFFIGAGIAAIAVSWAFGFVGIALFGPVEPMTASALVVAFGEAIASAAITLVLGVMLARIYLQLSGRGSLDVSVPSSGT